MPLIRHSLIAGLALLAAGRAAAAADSWPSLRGPSAQGITSAKGLPLRWSETEHVAWKTAIPGEGWSSPVVADGAVWMTTAIDGGRSLHAIKVDVASGKILGDATVFTVEAVPKKHARNSYASPTPVVDGKRVFVQFGAMGTACLSAEDGRTLWANHDYQVDYDVGAGSSPVLWHNLLLIPFDGIDAQFEVGLDAATGKQVWRTDRSATARLAKLGQNSRKSFGTPLTLTIDGQDQSILPAAERMYAYDPATGKELWYVDYTGYSIGVVPVSDGKMLVFCTGFDHSEVWGVALGGAHGDVTASHVKWKVKLAGLSQPSPILIGGRCYIVNDYGILTCLDAATGKQLWKERIGSDFAASPILADGRIYFFDCGGKTTVIEPGDAYKMVATSQLDGGFMASPAVVGKALILRTKTHLYRIE